VLGDERLLDQVNRAGLIQVDAKPVRER